MNDKDVFLEGIENKLSIDKNFKYTSSINIKIIFYYIVLSLVTKYNNKVYEKLFLINGKSQRRMKFDYSDNKIIFRGICYKNFSELFFGYHFVSPFKRKDRIRIICSAFKTFNNDNKYLLGSWIEFNIIKNYFMKNNVSSFSTRSHYDEITTWISKFSNNSFKLNVYQHGIVKRSDTISHKIKYDSLFAFDNYSIDVFKKNVILNNKCEYAIFPFLPSVNFTEYKKEKTYYYIGIIEQKNSHYINKIIDNISSVNNNIVFVIMLHPLSKNSYSGNNIICEKIKKYSNLDMYITDSSTLLIDLCRAKINKNLIFTDPNMIECFSNYPTTFINDINEINTIIRKETNKHFC